MSKSRDEFLLNQLQDICQICQAIITFGDSSDEAIIRFLDNFDKENLISSIWYAIACDYFATLKAGNYFTRRAQIALDAAINLLADLKIQADFSCLQALYRHINKTQEFNKANTHQFLEKIVRRECFPPNMMPNLEMCLNAMTQLGNIMITLDDSTYKLASVLLKKFGELPEEVLSNLELLVAALGDEARCLYEALSEQADYGEMHHLITRFALLSTHAETRQESAKLSRRLWLIRDVLESDDAHRYLIRMRETLLVLDDEPRLLVVEGEDVVMQDAPAKPKKRSRDEEELEPMTLERRQIDLSHTMDDLYEQRLLLAKWNPESEISSESSELSEDESESSCPRPMKRGRWDQ